MRSFFRYVWDILLRGAGAVIGVMRGGSLTALGVMMAVDYMTGIALGALGKSKKTADGAFSVRTALLGLLRKGAALSIVLLAATLDRFAGHGETLFRATIGFYLCAEGLSIIENAVLLGVPVPGFLQKALQSARRENGNSEMVINGNSTGG